MRLYSADADQAPGQSLPLSSDHTRMLLDESGISPEIAAERGYRTVRRRAELSEYKAYQRRVPALLVPVYSPDGETTLSQLRPDNSRKDKKGKPLKYETPGGSKVILDVHPRMRERVRHRGGGELFVTEGIKKADALTSRGAPTVGGIGVWNFQRGGELLPCWNHVALKGRRVYVVFDSDVMAKENVQLALERLVAALEKRGADVRVVYLPDGEGGEKVGVDDYLVAGGTVAELKALARRFEPEDLGWVRLSRDAKLKAIVDELWRIFWAFDWKGMGGHSARDVFEELIRAVGRCGKPHGDGVRAEIAWRTLQERANIGSFTTLSKAIARLEGWGLCYRDNEGRKAGKTGAFVLRASVYQVGGGGACEEKIVNPQGGSDPDATQLRAPRLRWSDPGRKARRGLVRGTRRVRETRLPARPPRKRLGKIRGAVIDALDVAGGELPLDDLYDVLNPSKEPGKRRPRDMRRRQLPMLERAGIIAGRGELVVRLTNRWRKRLDKVRERGVKLSKSRNAAIEALDAVGGALQLDELYDVLNPGKPPEKRRLRDLRRRVLPMLEEAGIVTVKEELVVKLTDNWVEALENAREAGGELEAEDAARKRHRIQREAFRDPHRDRVSTHPANAGGDAWIEELKALPEPPSKEDLYRIMHGEIPVSTPRGDGLLWQVFSEQVGVILDADPDQVAFFHPMELVVDEAVDGAA